MNERIKELAERAKDWKRGNGGMDYHAVDLEKFAELIIQECMDNLSWHGHDEAVSQLDWFMRNKIRS